MIARPPVGIVPVVGDAGRAHLQGHGQHVGNGIGFASVITRQEPLREEADGGRAVIRFCPLVGGTHKVERSFILRGDSIFQQRDKADSVAVAMPAEDKLVGIPGLNPLLFGGAEQPRPVRRIILAVVADVFGQLPSEAQGRLIPGGLIVLGKALNDPPTEFFRHDPGRHGSIGRIFATG